MGMLSRCTNNVLKVGVAYRHVQFSVKVNGRNSVCVITKSAILISAQFNISPHYSFMVQNQFSVSLCLTIAI